VWRRFVRRFAATERATVTPADTDGLVCVSGIEWTNPRGTVVTHAISNVVFGCPEAWSPSANGITGGVRSTGGG
jgi:hypothetical protein